MRAQKVRLHHLYDEQGAVAVEFAIVSGAFFMLLLGIIEYGLLMFTRVTLESAVQQSGRAVALGTVAQGCPDRVCTITKLIKDKTQSLMDPTAVHINARVVTSGGTAPATPDVCLEDSANPYPAACGRWIENGGDPNKYDPPSGLNNVSLGQAGDMVEVRATYAWDVIFPMFRSAFGNGGVLTLSSTTVVKNEPF